MSINRVLLIGIGAWSQKIAGVIKAHDVAWKVEVSSARNFISMESSSAEFTDMCSKFDIFWITTSPKNQIQVLKQFEKTNRKIILDKPIVTNTSEITMLEEIIHNSQCKIYLSQPWTYSNLWSKMKMLLLSINGEALIKTEREGNLIRAEFPPEIDWIPHDLYLLADYVESLEKELRNTNLVSREKNNQHISMRYRVGQDRTFEISAGYANERKAQWWAYSEGKLLAEVNFNSGKLIDHRGLVPVKFDVDSENPIMSMLGFILDNEPTVDWKLIFDLYRDLVRAGKY